MSTRQTAQTYSQAAQSANERYEDFGARINPLAAAYVELRDKVFALADDLGIGSEVRTFYHDVAIAAKGGQAAGYLSAAALSGGDALAVYYSGASATGAAIGMSAGMIGGLVVAVLSIFGSDDDDDAKQKAADEKAKAEKRIAAYEAEMLRHWSLARMSSHARSDAKELRARAKLVAQPVHIMVFGYIDPSVLLHDANASDKMAELYDAIAARFRKEDAALFVVGANIGRLVGWRKTVIDASPLRAKIDHALALEQQRQVELLRIARVQAEQAAQAKSASVTLATSGGAVWKLLALAFGAWRLWRKA